MQASSINLPMNRESKSFSQPLPIPYGRVLEALRSGWQVCHREKGGKGIEPNRFVLCFNPYDRKAREKYENVFIHEITTDILSMLQSEGEDEYSSIQVEVSTERKLTRGRMRFECFHDDTLLFRFDLDKGSEYQIEGTDMEWNAVSILPKEEDVTRNILVVDDEPVLCAVLQKMLTRLDYAVITAHDGLEAVKILANMQVDLVISDLRMPRMDGWMLLQQIREREPDLPVILITGYHSDYSESRAEESAANAYISKPFSFQQIKDVVSKVMETKDQRNRSVTMISTRKKG